MVKRQGILNRISFFSSCVHIMSHLFPKKIRKRLVPHEMLVSIALTDLRYLYWICREMHYPTWDDVISHITPHEMQVSLMLSHVGWRDLTCYPTWDAGISRVIPREMKGSHALPHVRCRYLSCYSHVRCLQYISDNAWDAWKNLVQFGGSISRVKTSVRNVSHVLLRVRCMHLTWE